MLARALTRLVKGKVSEPKTNRVEYCTHQVFVKSPHRKVPGT